MLHMMEFLNPTFNAGPNVTVRKGRKWMDALTQLEGLVEHILIGCSQLAVALPARVISCHWYNQVKDIPQEFFTKEHDPSCRTVPGLMTELERVYGADYQVGGLTVVEFEVRGDAPHPLVIDNRDIVADTKQFLRDRAARTLSAANSMRLAEQPAAVVQARLNEAGNLGMLAALLKSRQTALMILISYGGPGPKFIIEPNSMQEVEDFLAGKVVKPVDAGGSEPDKELPIPDTSELLEDGTEDLESLCYNCKEPIGDPGTLCATCQDEAEED